MQLPNENIGENAYNFRLDKDFLNRIPKAQIIKKKKKQKTDKLYLKFKTCALQRHY